ncbi:MAG TPA: transcription-repair coupling factor [Dehalococcoidia bacterium]|nr:transcription-repair coupling factor [Dehalococcoidia bacterium]
MNLLPLLSLVRAMPAYRQLVEGLLSGPGQRRATVLDAAKPYFLAALHRDLSLPMLIITPRPEGARQLYDQLGEWRGMEGLHLFPELDLLPYEELSPDPATVQERLRGLWALCQKEAAPLVVASATAVMSKTIPYASFSGLSHRLTVGQEVDLFQLWARWQHMGYQPESTVEVPGSIARRGGILDIYSPAEERPARLELVGNRIDSLRLFDPSTQRSLGPVDSVTVIPAREFLIPQGVTGEALLQALGLDDGAPEAANRLRGDIQSLVEGRWFPGQEFYSPLFNDAPLADYLPPNALVVVDKPEQVEAAAADFDAKASEMRRGRLERGELPPGFPVPYFTWKELKTGLNPLRQLSLRSWDIADTESYRLGFAPAPAYGGRTELFTKDAARMLQEGYRVVAVSQQAGRLSELLNENDVPVSPQAGLEKVPPSGSLALIQGSLAGGWWLDRTILLSDAELFGLVKERRLAKRRPVRRFPLTELSPGDYVVHVEHGIARYGGLVQLTLEEREREYLVLEYALGDKLYVPIDQMDRVSRYVGPGGAPPALSRLGSAEWLRTKQRVRKSVGDMARELLSLYAAREVIPGFAFSADTVWQQELEASFPYMETPDQAEAVSQVKRDMEETKPMDRLVCGDVGYGKTEVALRAAFKAVQDGKQVAVLVPTTVLAQQHYNTFRQRLAAFPVRVEMLSRFRSEREQQQVVEGLANGSVDICIGTHRLLQKDVAFKELGLVIIDEEQRFGVAHKERLKQMRREVDVLTLSATPIPRTLHMSLAGVRDMSVMETPPEERLPVKTYVAEYQPSLVRQAILRELERGGQVFFVHNRVHSIGRVARELAELVPEASILVAHGQMPEEELERVMLDFSQRRGDVLVATTIIESGLDLPNVNTLIVRDADRLGLTQLYQLRGRVGRGSHRAYAYFFYSQGKLLTEAAAKRLQTIFQATELGAGFTIAMKDLEIRGAGNLLGAEQSGHIGAVGFDLYTRLLAEAVEELKASLAGERPRARPAQPPPSVDLPLSARIPQDYVPDEATRLALYQRLAGVASLEELAELAQELADRFGPPPAQVSNLLYMVEVKVLACRAGLRGVAREDNQVVLKLGEGNQIDRDWLEGRYGAAVRVGPTQVRLNLKRLGRDWPGVLKEVLGALQGSQ